MMQQTLTPYEQIIKARINLLRDYPFFGSLALSLKINENKEMKYVAGVDARFNLFYNPERLKDLKDNQITGLLAHEVGHIVFSHLLRKGTRDCMVYNYAADLVLNCILNKQGFVLPDGGLIPDHDNKFIIKGDPEIIITDIDKKCAEVVYDEIIRQLPQQDDESEGAANETPQDGKGESPKHYDGFDEHIFDNDLTDDEKKEIEKDIKQKITDAYTISRQQGKLPAGLETFIKELLFPQINWRNKLYKYITNSLPTDYSYAKRSRKSLGKPYYLPGLLKENIKVVVSVDTSGSIDQKQFSEFITEIISIAKSFQNIEITVIQCDAKIQSVMDMKNGNVNKIKNIKIVGGGGTSHFPVVDYLNDKMKGTNILVAFTDGYSDIEDCFNKLKCDKIIALTTNNMEMISNLTPYGKIILIK
jgi:predicted metal-dependent peptidase